MSTQSTASAASAAQLGWHQLDWSRIHGTVRRLQARIVKATQVGDWRRVKALQRALTRSFSGKALAVKRVTENQGKHTPGVDRAIWSVPEAKRQAIETLGRRGYRSLPLRRVHIPKANGKTRALGIPTLRDRAMQALHLLALSPVSETCADRNSYGFRPERSTADAIQQCHTVLSGRDKAQWVLEGDIKGCFDHISHDWLVSNVPMDREILRKWLKAGYVEMGRLFPTEAGTPQGGIISPTLANWALDGLEAELEARFGSKGNRRSGKNKVNLVRYADDFIITGSSKELLENEVKPMVAAFLATRGLELSQEKTRITHVAEGFDFLGQTVRKFRMAIIITPSKKNVQAFKTKVKSIFAEQRTAKQETLILKLNPVVRGWANYHRTVNASKTFAAIDAWLWQKTWQWARRRHPNKSAGWTKVKYFGRIGARNWVFASRTTDSDGGRKFRSLVQASDTKIRRYTKIKGEANPFDPQWETYFEDRLGLKMQGSVAGRRKLLNLWWRQDKRCEVCGEPITTETGWHVHHRVPREQGGSDAQCNLALLHPNCHRQLHANGWKLEAGSL
ncbi:MAG TPA: group II intron reverse transcriptase/maturase [Rhodocyclaceae bacterium]|nr:group II intron reverse transcriptase/maturase [Rhodocyclaceae bacterium]HMV55078.1 group II intron reverse transcriptase/maturase [Rhodocyclaceae bacterium]HMZ83894.1 group II intron reverse transcriptase/maturase [Rhodocyclaceae bacterium]HNA02309.1 group II intron reverse transcriptase/maturase [Rhodocyclaceae bacterium]HNB78273.1 group II intron reverse transcriptase/maturase [Rhodocyclaceae bacterium]